MMTHNTIKMQILDNITKRCVARRKAFRNNLNKLQLYSIGKSIFENRVVEWIKANEHYVEDMATFGCNYVVVAIPLCARDIEALLVYFEISPDSRFQFQSGGNLLFEFFHEEPFAPTREYLED
jgi:hypothetical protein